MKIEILGSGCAKCKKLAENTQKALEMANIEGSIDKVTDLAKIMSYNVISTPGLVVDGEVKSTGKLLKPDEIVAILTK